MDFCGRDDHGGAVHRCIHAVVHLIEDHAQQAGLPVRFAATKAIEGDPLILEQLALDENEQDMLEHIVRRWRRSAVWTAAPPSRICVFTSSSGCASRRSSSPGRTGAHPQ